MKASHTPNPVYPNPVSQSEAKPRHTDVCNSCHHAKACSPHAQVIDAIIAEEMQRQEYAAVWANDAAADAATAAAGAALYDLAISEQQPAPAPQARRMIGPGRAAFNGVRSGRTASTDAEQHGALWQAQMTRLESGSTSVVATAFEEINRQLEGVLAP